MREVNFITSKMAKKFNNTFWIGLNELSTSIGYVWSDLTPGNKKSFNKEKE
jgi:cbb3-type cytochrome oxidase subunit 3